jgi:hypothetical protein
VFKPKKPVTISFMRDEKNPKNWGFIEDKSYELLGMLRVGEVGRPGSAFFRQNSAGKAPASKVR